MKKNVTFILLSFLLAINFYGQKQTETEPPFNIKTVAFTQTGLSVNPFFVLGDPFSLEFDDLFGNEADYYFTVTLCNADWSKTILQKVEYLNGLDNQRIQDYRNSLNTLQIYSHYKISFPNKYCSITKSGNYLISIFNDDNELVLSRKCIVYENTLSVAPQVKRIRDHENIDQKQNIELAIDYGNLLLQNPVQNLKVTIFKNGNLNESLQNIKPQYTIGTQLIYRYNTETQFWGGNEFYTLDNSNVRAVNNSVGRVSSGEIYNSHLYLSYPRKNKPYTFFPDFDGNFVVLNSTTDDPNIKADYTWVYFSLADYKPNPKESIYVTGMFNNYSLNDAYKLEFNKESENYEKAILIKQGYTNYQYVLVTDKSKIDYPNAIDGNFYQTLNNYIVVVYYKGNNDRYERVIGFTTTSSANIQN